MQNGKLANRTTFNVNDMAIRTPPVDAAAALQKSLSYALFATITPEDVTEIANAQIAKAKSGDSRAAKLIFDIATKSRPDDSGPKEKVVFAESVGKRQLQTLIAYAIRANGSMGIGAISHLTQISEEKVAGLIDSPWFKTGSDGVTLTTEGKQAIG